MADLPERDRSLVASWLQYTWPASQIVVCAVLIPFLVNIHSFRTGPFETRVSTVAEVAIFAMTH